MSPRCRLTRSSTHRLAIPVRRRLCTRFRSTTTTLSRGSGQDRRNTMTMSPWPMSIVQN
uniref:Uncharacterized protein n=1 Tax=Oryza meridionalis TaxID=40149 RepID=A0A0E0F6K5_9ORYZ